MNTSFSMPHVAAAKTPQKSQKLSPLRKVFCPLADLIRSSFDF
ncbi:MAG: hypothetical protein ACKOEZ_06625 [Spartobacteria bacterium]